jgi:hypothetical protein
MLGDQVQQVQLEQMGCVARKDSLKYPDMLP